MTDTKLADVHELAIADVYPDENNPRTEFNNIEQLAAEIDELGQLEPVIVRKYDDTYRLVSGERRYRALKHLGHTTILARIATDDEQEAALIALSANSHEPLSEVERSRGVQRILFFDPPMERAARVTGYDTGYLKTVKTGMSLVKDYGEDMSLDRIYAATEFADDPEAVNLIETCGEDKFTGVLAKLRRQRKLAEQHALAKAVIKAAGCELRGNGSGGVYVGRGDEKPEGATFATIQQSYLGDTYINWYGPEELADEEERERAAKAAERDVLAAALEAEHLLRVAFIVENLAGAKATVKLAHEAWDDAKEPVVASSSALKDEWADVAGYQSRIWCSVLAGLEQQAHYVLRDLALEQGGYWTSKAGRRSLAYLDALRADGYEPATEDEAARYKALAALLKPAKKKGVAS